MSLSVEAGETARAAKPVVEIAASSGWRAVDLRELWRYRELMGILVWRDIKVRYRQTFLGIGWVIAQPLLTMGIFTLLFNRVARIQPDANVPYSIFIMAALVPWTFFASGAANSGNSLIGNAHLISKVYFPRMIIPAASVLAGAIDMLVTCGALAVMMVVARVAVSWIVLILPLVVVVAALFTLGIGLWLSAMNVEYRDVRVVVPFLLQLWLYATPVAYPLSVLPAWARPIALANPMTAVVETFRSALFGRPINWWNFAYACAVTAAVLISGAFYFRRSERRFADIL